MSSLSFGSFWVVPMAEGTWYNCRIVIKDVWDGSISWEGDGTLGIDFRLTDAVYVFKRLCCNIR